jgi:hypothetical protein
LLGGAEEPADRSGSIHPKGNTHMDLAHREVSIRERAYAIWEEEGRPDGREWDHWERASREVMNRAILSTNTATADKAASVGTARKGTRARARQTSKPVHS